MASAKNGLTGLIRRPSARPPPNAETESGASMSAAPADLQNAIAVDLNGTAATIYVSREFAGNPYFQTWVSDNSYRGMTISVKPVGPDEIADYRARHNKAQNADSDLAFRNKAIALIKQAAAYRASDMHIRINGQYGEVQIVVKGELRVLHRLSHEAGETLIRVLYQGVARTKSDSLKPTEYQNAQIPGDILEAGITSIRLVRGPCYPGADGGQFMTLRLQYDNRPVASDETAAVLDGTDGPTPPISAGKPSLPPLVFPKPPPGKFLLGDMGYTPAQIEKLAMLMSAPSGIVLFTGPTGSGKTTTMFECLSEMARKRPWDRQVTVEDPVEYPMEWAVQLGLTDSRSDTESGAAFLEAVRVMLRMAPNVILIGEIRGAEVAAAAMNAAITGHLVISTLHVNDPYLFVERLEFMDRTRLARDLFCDPKIVRGVVAQRLIPLLCPDCRIPLAAAPDLLPERIIAGLAARGPLDRVALRGPGCPRCVSDGTLGRQAFAEIVVMDDALAADFIEHGTAAARTRYRERAGSDPSMLEAAIASALSGDVDPRAVEKNIDLIFPPA